MRLADVLPIRQSPIMLHSLMEWASQVLVRNTRQDAA
jgi:hypothetical protein